MNINVEVLLQPIDSKSPVGENIEYELVYNEIRQARESDPEYLSGGEWSITEPRSADWKKYEIFVSRFSDIKVKIFRSVVGMWSPSHIFTDLRDWQLDVII